MEAKKTNEIRSELLDELHGVKTHEEMFGQDGLPLSATSLNRRLAAGPPFERLPITTPPPQMGTSVRTHARHLGHCAGAASRWASRRRTSGSVGQGERLLRRGFIFESTQVLEEGKRNHREERVVMEPGP